MDKAPNTLSIPQPVAIVIRRHDRKHIWTRIESNELTEGLNRKTKQVSHSMYLFKNKAKQAEKSQPNTPSQVSQQTIQPSKPINQHRPSKMIKQREAKPSKQAGKNSSKQSRASKKTDEQDQCRANREQYVKVR